MEEEKEDSLHGRNLVGADVDERGSLKDGGADHQSMVSRPSYELATQADQGTLYHFNPCAFSQVVARFHHRTDRGYSPESGEFFIGNGFGSQRADNSNHTRRLQNSKASLQRKVGKTIPTKQRERRPHFAVGPLPALSSQWK